ncbi:polygalacturonase At1g48100 [Amaranthus tricolor]|uniref:polygalacturonase At1g48100 n=1 Tax=Amaranthus tricolor TaxID=29722 RepID=UPI00258B2E0C|nr:polygalacturonase At1g48100 [Amaranthus tricolor]
MKISILYLLIFLASFHVLYLFCSIEARKSSVLSRNKHQKHKHNKGKGKSGYHCPTPADEPLVPPHTYPKISNVLSFGAKGDGATDDSEALLEAWKAACKVEGATVEIPSGYKFLIKPITLQGPCLPQLVLQIDGTVLAPSKLSCWPKSGLFQWINFKWVQNFTIQGSGVVDGQGSEWWISSQPTTYKKTYRQHVQVPSMKPTAIRFYSSNSITVRDISIRSSPLVHLKFDDSVGVQVHNITISSPEDSPNTDGIHLQNSRDVQIHHSTIGCGDDCVSIQTGCSNIHVHHVNCGPGHGISLGGLGKDRSIACVSDIVVEDIIMQNTLFGARIKTWPGGIGSVKNITFSNIQVSDVKVPIVIDQYYCANNFHCKNETGAVAISNVQYSNILGTYSAQPIHLACSNDIPCHGVDLINIQMKPSPSNRGLQQALCSNSYGRIEAPLVPQSIDYCLRESNRQVPRLQRSHEKVCQRGY